MKVNRLLIVRVKGKAGQDRDEIIKPSMRYFHPNTRVKPVEMLFSSPLLALATKTNTIAVSRAILHCLVLKSSLHLGYAQN